ncbi:MAG: 50S ribosomal protein L19 [Firmicutes bacterium]|nr:50S ribosomal protein L19 [Bacillota bacterium]MCL2255626.1 50S ribosomal protein L19 [Bacillota bacterium]
MRNVLIDAIEKEYMKTEVPAFDVGDVVKVFVKVVEGTRERLQAFEGTVIAKKNGGVRESFTVRRVSYGVGIERSFAIHSPRIDRVEVIKKGKVRRAKLYYLRNLTGKAAKIKEDLSSKTAKAPKAKAE